MGGSKLQRLPRPPLGKESYVSITPFDTGKMVTPSNTVVEEAQGTSMATSWRFFIKHEKSGTCLWFDMGISHVCHLFLSLKVLIIDILVSEGPHDLPTCHPKTTRSFQTHSGRNVHRGRHA